MFTEIKKLSKIKTVKICFIFKISFSKIHLENDFGQWCPFRADITNIFIQIKEKLQQRTSILVFIFYFQGFILIPSVINWPYLFEFIALWSLKWPHTNQMLKDVIDRLHAFTLHRSQFVIYRDGPWLTDLK